MIANLVMQTNNYYNYKHRWYEQVNSAWPSLRG